MSVPYTFASATTPLPLAQLDANFATPITLGSTAVILGNTYAQIDGLFLGTPTFITPTLDTPISGDLVNCTGYTYANLDGTVPTWNQDTTGNAATADSATSAVTATSSSRIQNTGGWSVTPSGTQLIFSYNGTNVASLDSSGNFVAKANVTAYGSL